MPKHRLMDASTEQKIRLLAIAIREMETEAIQGLLDHMPKALKERILNQTQSSDEVSDQERLLAIQTIESILVPQEQTLLESPSTSLPIQQDQSSIGWVESVEAHPLEALVEVLSLERPTVIATILRSLPSQLGQSILPRLQLDLAKEALDWIPRLDYASTTILDAIGQEFQQQVAAIASRIQTQQQGQEKLLQLRSVFDEPKFTNPVPVSSDSIARVGEAPRPFVIPLQSVSDRDGTIRLFMKLDDLDLLRVLYSHPPEEVRRFLAGANKSLRTRIEKLTPSSGLKKLRRELACAPSTDEKTWCAIAERFTKTAMEIESADSSSDRYLASA
jgi:hypothetical protein